MRRALAAAVLCLALGAAPAYAQSGPPTLRTFDTCGLAFVEALGDSAVSPPNVLTTDCDVSFSLASDLDTPTRITFLRPQRYVALDIRAGVTAGGPVELKAYATTSEPAALVDADSDTAPPAGWVRVSVGADRIDYVEFAAEPTSWRVDDLTFSAQEQPDTVIEGGPTGETTDRNASFTVRSSIEGAAISCMLDGNEAPCGDLSFTDLAVGRHTLTAVANDGAGTVDPTPAIRTWTIVPVVTPPPPPPPPPVADRDGDFVIDPADNCPDDANADQADRDGDDIGNACDELPPGDRPPIAGVRATVEAVSGDVFVRFPRGSAAASQLRPGFVPLKGIAAIPIGSTIDATKGQLAVTSAAAFGRGPKGRTRARSRGTFAAALFTIKQRRARRRARSQRPTTDLVLRTPPRAAAACAARRPPSGPKGIVRTLSGTGKGQFRAIGGASTTTVRNATFVTTDRCNGTQTEVGRGRAAVFDRARDRTVVVRAGQAYLARARLFQARRGRGRP